MGLRRNKGTQELAEKDRLFVQSGQMPRAGARIKYTSKDKVQKKRAQDKFKGVKAESGGLKPRTSRIAISPPPPVERVTSEVRNEGMVQHG